jgi:hypothetical protein
MGDSLSGVKQNSTVEDARYKRLLALASRGGPLVNSAIIGSGKNVAIGPASSLTLGPFPYGDGDVLDAIVFPTDLPPPPALGAPVQGTWGIVTGNSLTWSWVGPPGSPAHLFVRNGFTKTLHFNFVIVRVATVA